MTEADYIVIRPAAGLPTGFLAPHLDGRWYDKADVPEALPDQGLDAVAQYGEYVAVPSGRFEVRDDGAVAEVWEVRP